MALVVKDRVKETTATTGTGTLTLAGAVTGFQTFTSVLSNGDTTYYGIFESSTGEFEVGLGTFTSSGTTLARTTILESSNSGSAINLTAGAADVFITQPAEKAVYLDGSGYIATADGRNLTNVDAATLDSLDSTQFLRSDTSDTMTGDLTVSENLKADGGTLIMGDDAYSTSTSYVGMKTSHMSGTTDYMIISGHSDGNTYISAKDGADVSIRGGGNVATYGISVYPDQNPTVGTSNYTIWHAGNDGSGSGLDADTLDGVQGASYLRSDTDDTFTGTLTVSGTVTADGLTVDTNTLHVDATNNRVGIGTTSPATPFTLEAAGSSSAGENTHLRINDTTNMAAGVGGVIQLSGEADSGGTTQYTFATIKGIKENGTTGNYDGALTFATRANGVSPTSEAMRIDSSGNLLVGKTTSTIGTAGTSIESTGKVEINAASTVPLSISRITDEGDMVAFYEGSTLRGRIGIELNDMFITSANSGIRFDYNNTRVVPCTTTGAGSDGTDDLGDPAVRWQNGYFSANLYANALIHDGDSDTFLSFGTDAAYLSTGGTDRIVVNSSGVQLGDSGNGYFRPVSGGYGSIEIDGGAHNTWEGYSIGGRAVFMHDNSNTTLLYDDVNDKRLFAGTHGGAVNLYHNGTSKLDTTSTGANIDGDLNAVDNIYVATNIYHEGDTNTYVGFRTDAIDLYTGGTQAAFSSSGLFLTDGSLAEDYDALSGTTPTCNVDNGAMFSLTMTGNTTFTFSGAASGYIQGFVLQLTGNGSTVTWPTSVDWAGGTAPDAPASGETDILVFISRDGGTTWYGALAIDAAA